MITINTTFETEGGSTVSIQEMVGAETWVSTTVGSDGEAQTVAIPWADWEQFLTRRASKQPAVSGSKQAKKPTSKKKTKK